MALTRMAWAAIVTSAHRFSQDLQTRTWHSRLTFLHYNNNTVAEPRQKKQITDNEKSIFADVAAGNIYGVSASLLG